jgi:hypothetical protein
MTFGVAWCFFSRWARGARRRPHAVKKEAVTASLKGYTLAKRRRQTDWTMPRVMQVASTDDPP